MPNAKKEVYEFDRFRLDVSERLLFRDGERVPLSEKAFETLCALVRRGNHLASKQYLLDEVWSDATVEENNLDKSISILRRVLGEGAINGKFIETVRGHGYRFLPEVRALSTEEIGRHETWKEDAAAFSGLETELTEKIAAGVSGLKSGDSRITNYEVQEPKSRSQRRSFNIPLSITLALLILATLIAIYSWRQPTINPAIKTVAVLPFKPLVAGTHDETLELGMADALISKLSASERVTVRPLSATRRYTSIEQDAVRAGRELGVEAVLDGSIQISGDRVRVLAKLLRVGDGKQLWAEQFDEKFTNILDVQESISQRVAVALKIELVRQGKRRDTEIIEAYQLYMKGRFHVLKLTRPETDKAMSYFQQAIALDPNYAQAHLGLARTYLPMALTSDVPSSEVIPKAKESALRAVEIDSSLAEAHVILGLIKFWYDWDWQAAERYFLKAIELNPNSAEAHFAYGHLLSNTKRHRPAFAEVKLSKELEPVSLVTNALEGQVLFFAGNYDDALVSLKATIDFDPSFWLSHLFISRVYTEKGMHSEAVAAAQTAGERSFNTQSQAYRAYALAKWGKSDEARVVLEELLKLSATRYVPPYNIAAVYSGLGEREKALEYLEKGFRDKDLRMVFLPVEPMWSNLRSDARFITLLKRMTIEP